MCRTSPTIHETGTWWARAIRSILLVPATEIACCSDAATNRARVGPDGIDQRGRAGLMSRPKRSRSHFAKRTSIGGKAPAGTRYQSTPSNETVHGAELRSTIVAAAGAEAGRETSRAHPAATIAANAKYHQGRFIEEKLDFVARLLLHGERIIATW
jgi:hypothetical protein